jgi:hypothetical protein
MKLDFLGKEAFHMLWLQQLVDAVVFWLEANILNDVANLDLGATWTEFATWVKGFVA